jgi:hypothetical protein
MESAGRIDGFFDDDFLDGGGPVLIEPIQIDYLARPWPVVAHVRQIEPTVIENVDLYAYASILKLSREPSLRHGVERG